MASKFVRTAKEMAKEPRGQAALVLEALATAPGPQTIAEITESIKDNLVTRQDPERVVAYYITMFKKSGIVATAKDPEPVDTGDQVDESANLENEPAETIES
jgi:hypothetical protein